MYKVHLMYLVEILVVLLLVGIGMYIARTLDPIDPQHMWWDEKLVQENT